MVAVAAGDADEAQRLARRADALLAEPPLTLLLSAQAAQLKGDEQAAARYFSAMLDRAETEFLGLRGLIMQALRRQDEATALTLTERAKALRPKTPWVVSSLFELQARAGKWAAADETLADAAKRKTLAAPVSRQHRAILHLEQSREAAAAGRPGDALKLAAKAHTLDPGFAPAAVHYAGLLRIGGKLRHARKVIEAAWRAAPHPSLAASYEEIHADETPLARVKLFERLAALNPAHAESSLALAAAAFKAKLWGEARRHLHLAGANSANATATMPSPRVCKLMADLEEAEHDDHPAARSWLTRAATTPTADPAYQCRVCGAEHAEWSALCPCCRSFGSLAWRVPGPVATPHAAGPASDLAPALPVPGGWTLDGNAAAPSRP
jgi:HemY protein